VIRNAGLVALGMIGPADATAGVSEG